jgi:hypothetical protein
LRFVACMDNTVVRWVGINLFVILKSIENQQTQFPNNGFTETTIEGTEYHK